MGYKLTSNSYNCTLTVFNQSLIAMDTENYSNDTYAFKIKSKEGYVFRKAPSITFIDTNGFENYQEFEKKNNTEYYLTLYLCSDCIIDAIAVLENQYYSINTPNDTIVTVTDTNGYTVKNNLIQNGLNYFVNVHAINNKTIESGTLTYIDENNKRQSIEITDERISITPYSDIKVNAVLLSNKEFHEIFNMIPNSSFFPEFVYRDTETVITIESNEGYYFKNEPIVKYLSNIGIYEELEVIRVTDTEYKCTIPIIDAGEILIQGECFIKSEYENKYGIIKVFNPTFEELEEISRQRFTYADRNGVKIEDLGIYISRLFKLYCNVPTVGKGGVTLGDYDLNVECNIISQYEITVDCGYITVEGINNNALDYTDTVIEIFIPFVGDKFLDNVKIIDEKIKLLYKVNVLTGDCIAFLVNSKGDTIYKYNGSISFNIPYYLNDRYNGYKEYDIKEHDLSLMGFQPYLTVRSKLSVNSENSIQNTYKRDYIANFDGYNEFTDFVLDNIYIVDDEKTELKRLLEGGVII